MGEKIETICFCVKNCCIKRQQIEDIIKSNTPEQASVEIMNVIKKEWGEYKKEQKVINGRI